LGRGTAVAYNLIRRQIPFLEDDVPLSPLIEQVRQLVANGTIKEAVENAVIG
jgi:histidine ammonia-lyase